MSALPISPLSLDQFTRDLWGEYDAAAISQLAPLAAEACYQPKFYKSPATANEIVPGFGYISHGLEITPGSIIYGFYLPGVVSTSAPPQWNVQITDSSLNHKFWDDPIPSFLIGSFKPCYLSALAFPAGGQIGSFPNLLNAPHPVVGNGLFLVELWETSGSQQRIELVIGVLEVVDP
jgi:hypothetical protein